MDPWALLDSAGPRKAIENPWSDHDDAQTDVKKTEKLIDIDDNPWSTTPTTLPYGHENTPIVKVQRPNSPDPWLLWSQQPSKSQVEDLNATFSQTTINDDNDDFGDFEDADTSSTPVAAIPNPVPVQVVPIKRQQPTQKTPASRQFVKPTPQPRTQKPATSHPSRQPDSTRRGTQGVPRVAKVPDPSVLFDADEESSSDHDDDIPVPKTKPWSQPISQPVQPSVPDDFDPWSPIDETPASVDPSMQSPASPPPQQKPFPTMAFSTPSTKLPLPSQAQPSQPQPQISTPSEPTARPRQIPRTIPPPQILLSLSLELISALPSLLSSSPSQASPSPSSLLTSTTTTIHSTFRILCGRKSRWRRDTFLSQSMTISAAGAPRGMKLAGIDKSVMKREDVVAEQLVERWKANAGRIKKGVAELCKAQGRKVPVPDLGGTLFVRTVKTDASGQKGVGVGGTKQVCILCGLRRDERCSTIDDEEYVYDAFGEWWVEHWGHKVCCDFWETHEEGLRGR